MPPVSLQGLQDLIRAGTIQRQDRVWTQGLDNWTPAGNVPALASFFMNPVSAQPVIPTPMPVQPPIPMAGPLPTPPPDAMLQYQTPPWAYAQYVHYAGFWRRFAAYIVDGVLLWIVQSISMLMIGVNPLTPTFNHTSPAYHPMLFPVQISGYAIAWLYCALMESSSLQGTVGKLVLDIKVTDLDGNRISFGRATGRHFAKIISSIILCIGYMMAGWTERKQALHDMMANTLVSCRS